MSEIKPGRVSIRVGQTWVYRRSESGDQPTRVRVTGLGDTVVLAKGTENNKPYGYNRRSFLRRYRLVEGADDNT